MSESSMWDVAVTVGEAATDLREVATRLASCIPLSGFDAERQARILDRLAEEITEAAAAVRGRP